MGIQNKEWKLLNLPSVESFVAKEMVPLLATNQLAAVRVPNIYSQEEIDIIVKNINKQGVQWYPNFEFKQGRIGICATEYHSKINGKEVYFLLEPESSKVRNNIFTGDLDPVKRMIGIFSNGYDASLATEENLNNSIYFTGLIRAMKYESTTHFDYAPRQLPGWSIADSEVQFAVVTYLQMPGTGGGLTVYDRNWKQEDDIYNKDIHEKGPDGFEEKFLEGLNSVTIYPNPGDMIIFNSRNFHKVDAVESDLTRFSINSFMCLKDGKLFFWN